MQIFYFAFFTFDDWSIIVQNRSTVFQFNCLEFIIVDSEDLSVAVGYRGELYNLIKVEASAVELKIICIEIAAANAGNTAFEISNCAAAVIVSCDEVMTAITSSSP